MQAIKIKQLRKELEYMRKEFNKAVKELNEGGYTYTQLAKRLGLKSGQSLWASVHQNKITYDKLLELYEKL